MDCFTDREFTQSRARMMLNIFIAILAAMSGVLLSAVSQGTDSQNFWLDFKIYFGFIAFFGVLLSFVCFLGEKKRLFISQSYIRLTGYDESQVQTQWKDIVHVHIPYSLRYKWRLSTVKGEHVDIGRFDYSLRDSKNIDKLVRHYLSLNGKNW